MTSQAWTTILWLPIVLGLTALWMYQPAPAQTLQQHATATVTQRDMQLCLQAHRHQLRALAALRDELQSISSAEQQSYERLAEVRRQASPHLIPPGSRALHFTSSKNAAFLQSRLESTDLAYRAALQIVEAQQARLADTEDSLLREREVRQLTLKAGDLVQQACRPMLELVAAWLEGPPSP